MKAVGESQGRSSYINFLRMVKEILKFAIVPIRHYALGLKQ